MNPWKKAWIDDTYAEVVTDESGNAEIIIKSNLSKKLSAKPEDMDKYNKMEGKQLEKPMSELESHVRRSVEQIASEIPYEEWPDAIRIMLIAWMEIVDEKGNRAAEELTIAGKCKAELS